MSITVPMDIHESPTEMVVVLPLWGVQKNSVSLKCEENLLHIIWKREKPEIKSSLVPLQEQCFWWIFEREISLPENTAFDRIQSELSSENILTIIIPKIIIPEKIVVEQL